MKALKIAVIALIFAAFAIFFLFVKGKKSKLYLPDTELGIRGPFNESIEMTKTHEQKLIYKVKYEFDEYGRRKTPSFHPESKKFAIFFGGSNTFGEGLPVEKTLPYLFSKKNPLFRSYNYAFPGWGPNNNLRQLQTSSINSQVLEKEGLVVYQYFDYHLRRVLGTVEYFSWSKGRSPSYQWVDGGTQTQGAFLPVPSFLFPAFKRSFNDRNSATLQ